MIIYGWRKSVQDLATATYLCGNCQNPSAHALRRAVTKFTLFFIPLFPISSRYFTVCTFCGMTNKLTKQEAQQVQAMQQAQPPAGYPQQAYPQQAYPQQAYPQPGYPQQQPQPGYVPQPQVQQYPQQQIQPPRQGF